MSVGLLVTYLSPTQAEGVTHYLPLALESEFHRLWLPLANKLNLQWVPLFSSGVSLLPNEVSTVVKELVKLQTSIEEESLSSKVKLDMEERCTRTIQFLETLEIKNVEDVFIG